VSAYASFVTGGHRLAVRSDLVGRDVENKLLDALIDQLPDHGGSLLVSGEPGIGKSALLNRASVRARELGVRTLTTAGVESEAELAFAGLHQLLCPVLELGVLLPDPQRGALEAAFGISRGVDSDPFLVALAAYQLVCEAADQCPLLLIADDAHWLDRSSLGVLSFLGRRLETEPIAFVAAFRAGYGAPLEEARLPILELDRLSGTASAELLDRNAPDLHPIRRARVLAEAAGNPLALGELSRIQPSLGEPTIEVAEASPALTGRLQRAFASRLDGLPEETRACLLAAALDGRASLAEVVRCAAMVRHQPVDLSALDPAAETELISVATGGVHFRHPLIRSAVVQAALPARVLAMYGALADVVADPERRLWHQAKSTVGFDEQVADALDEHSDAARRRGALTVAAAALERAAALTVDPRRKADRLVRAAEVAYELGLVDATTRLLRQAPLIEDGSLETARSAWLQQMISGDVWVEPGAAKTFVTIARQICDSGDAAMAMRSLVPIAHRCWWTRTRTTTRQFVVETAESIGVQDDDPLLLAVIALAHPEITGPSVLRRIALIKLPDVTDPIAAMHIGIAAEKAGDFPTGGRFLARALEGLREQGRLGALTRALAHFAWVATQTGDWRGATAAASEAAVLARDTLQPQYGLTAELIAALVAAKRGTEPDLNVILQQPERTLVAVSGGPLLAPAHLARGAEALGDGRHEDAFCHLWPVFDEKATAFHRFMRWHAVLDLVEAGTGSGHTEPLVGVISGLRAVSERSMPPILSAGLTCAAPLMAGDDDAEALFVEALDTDLGGYPFLRARTLYSFGRWLRRHRRNADSRPPLRDAVALFDQLGATRWSANARQEVRATGEKIGRRSSDARDRLTSQELQIARLAAQGLSNREIGERMFLSHRTVGSHLYRIFPKLEITSRGQLRDALSESVTD
jgi:DNA-binding CsgD family transcriptional regulator